MTTEDFFLDRIKAYKGLESAKSNVSARFGFFRLLVFAGLVFGLYLLNTEDYSLGWIISGISIALFAVLIVLHNKVKNRINVLKNIQQINAAEIELLKLKLDGFDSGIQYKDKQHPFINDLDSFGTHSLFQSINRCATKEGEEELVTMFRSKVDYKDVISRQTIVRELEPEIDWRQEFQSGNGADYNKIGDLKSLIKWVNEEPFYKNRKALNWLTVFYPLIPISILVLMTSVLPPAIGILLIFSIPMIFNKARSVITKVKENTSRRLEDLKRYSYLIKLIEDKSFESEELKKLQSKLLKGGKASIKIDQLKSTLTLMEGSDNVFFYFITHFSILWDFHTVRILDQWKEKNKDQIVLWINTVKKIDAYNSIAGFAFSNSNFTFPEIKNSEYAFKATALGHPLIPASERVNNDFEFSGDSKLMLITGSNMSGKSTFLRTIGVNIFLANLGAPVCAKECSLSPMYLYTSMRTEDSIEESTSSFYAELKRIEQLIDIAKTGDKVLFMLDEILKGTNSTDRHNGAEALIRQLTKFNLTGFISTHDLELTDLENEKGLQLSNYSFTSEFENDKLVFDYKIKNGPCTSFNASQLMKSIGIELLD